MATLKDLLFYKEYHANKVERHEEAVKHYDEEISKKLKDISISGCETCRYASEVETKVRKAILKCNNDIELYFNDEIEVSMKPEQEVTVFHTFPCEEYSGGMASVIFDGKESMTVATNMLEFKEVTK